MDVGTVKKHVCPFEGKELHTDRLVRDGLSRRNFYCLEWHRLQSTCFVFTVRNLQAEGHVAPRCTCRT